MNGSAVVTGTGFTGDMVGSTLWMDVASVRTSIGVITVFTSATSITVLNATNTGAITVAAGADIRRTLTGTSATLRTGMTFTANAASTSLNFTQSATPMTDVQFEQREYATQYINSATPTQTTTYMGRVIIN